MKLIVQEVMSIVPEEEQCCPGCFLLALLPCLDYPILAVLFCLFCSACPILPGMFCLFCLALLSCPHCPILAAVS
jgi:hypothetical protein